MRSRTQVMVKIPNSARNEHNAGKIESGPNQNPNNKYNQNQFN